MNIFGHNYIASRVLGRLNKYTIAGSQLPDIVPFVPNSVFSFEEIHEGGDILLDFLKREFPQKKDLALAMMAHSVKYGADKFNKEVDQWLLGNDQGRKAQIVSKISAYSKVNLEVAAKYRLHNYLWAGLDVYLLDNKKDFVESFFQNVPLVDVREIADILAKCFCKNPKRVLADVQKCLSPVQKLEPNLDSLVRWWQRTAKDLPEGDRIDIDKTASLLLEIEREFLPEWESVLQRVIGANRTGVWQPFCSVLPVANLHHLDEEELDF